MATTKLNDRQKTTPDSSSLKMYAALGSVVKAETFPGGIVHFSGNTGAMTDGRLQFQAIWLEKDATLTGVKWYQTTAGAYTADNNSKIGLYTYSGGTMTLVASCANDATLWKGTANTWITKAFSSTYAALAGLYFIGFLWNASATTTAPQIGATAMNTNAASLDFTNSAKIAGYVNTQTDLTTPQAHSGLTIYDRVAYFALY